MVGDIASNSESTSTTNDGEASDKCESPLIVTGNAEFGMVDNTTLNYRTSESEHLTQDQMLEIMQTMFNNFEKYWRPPRQYFVKPKRTLLQFLPCLPHFDSSDMQAYVRRHVYFLPIDLYSKFSASLKN